MSTTGGTTGVVTPLTPLTALAQFPNQYIYGMQLAWASTTTFTVSVGACRDASGLTDIVMGQGVYSYANQSNEWVTSLPVAVTVSSATIGAAGLDTGTLAASTNYYVYAIGDSKGFLPASVVFSATAPSAGVNTGGTTPTSVTLASGPTLPTGRDSNGQVRQYDCFRYIGSVVTDGSSHFYQFTQTGSQALRTMWFDPGTGPSTTGLTIASSGTSGSTTYANVGVFTTLIPQKAMELILDCTLIANTAGNKLYLAPPTVDNGTTATVGSMTNTSSVAVTAIHLAQLRVPCSLPNSTQRTALSIGNVMTVLYATTEASDAVTFKLSGYVDQL